MCLTGNFAISLMANEDVLAGFASQPSMPFMSQEALQMSAGEVVAIKNNIDKVGAIHCGSFEQDVFCTHKKIEFLDKTFNEGGKERIIFHQMPGKGHAILTLDFVDEVGHPTRKTLDDIFQYFDTQLEG
jgi:hypothetical protein